jgi:hypothetical protein
MESQKIFYFTSSIPNLLSIVTMYSSCDNPKLTINPVSVNFYAQDCFVAPRSFISKCPSQLSQRVDINHVISFYKHIINNLNTKIVSTINTMITFTSCKSWLTMKESTSCTNFIDALSRPYNEFLSLQINLLLQS